MPTVRQTVTRYTWRRHADGSRQFSQYSWRVTWSVIWRTIFSLGAFSNLRKATVSFVLSVRLSASTNNSAPTAGIFMKFYIWAFFENLSRKFKFHQNLTRITGTLHEDQCTLFILSRSFLLRMRNGSDRSCNILQNFEKG